MLEIKNDTGLTLQLPDEQRLTLEINSTIFDTDDVIRGSYSYPFKFGLNDNNCQFINNGHLPESLVEPDMQVLVTAGTLSFRAVLTYKTSGRYADAALLINLGEIAETIRNSPLREFVTDIFEVGGIEGQTPPTPLALANAAPSNYPIVFPPFYSYEQVEEEFKPTPAYIRPMIINYFNLSTGTYSNAIAGTGDRLMVPMIYMCWLVSYICKKLGLSPLGTLFNDPDLSRMILFNTQSTPGMDVSTGLYTVELGRHLGDITISDFFKSLRAYIGMNIEVNMTDRTATFNTYQSLRKMTNYLDLSDALVPDTEGVSKSEIDSYIVRTNVDSTENASVRTFNLDDWNLGAFALVSSYTVGSGKGKEVDLEIGTLSMIRMGMPDQAPAAPRWFVPVTRKKGNLADPFFATSDNYSPYATASEPEKIPKQTNPHGPTMLLYYGMRPASNNVLYPFATSISYDAKFKVCGNLSLMAGEVDDMWARYQRGYYEFLAFSKRITAVLRLSLAKLSTIAPSEPIGLRMGNQVLGKYLLEKLTYELPAAQGYALGKFEGVQLVPNILNLDPVYPGGVLWFQLVAEKLREVRIGTRLEIYYDIVFYLWKDGAYTEPTTDEDMAVNYRITTTLRSANGRPSQPVTENHNYHLRQHRTVISSDELLLIYDPANWLTNRTSMYYPLNGPGYRLR